MIASSSRGNRESTGITAMLRSFSAGEESVFEIWNNQSGQKVFRFTLVKYLKSPEISSKDVGQ
jgi:hypothetical protein